MIVCSSAAVCRHLQAECGSELQQHTNNGTDIDIGEKYSTSLHGQGGAYLTVSYLISYHRKLCILSLAAVYCLCERRINTLTCSSAVICVTTPWTIGESTLHTEVNKGRLFFWQQISYHETYGTQHS